MSAQQHLNTQIHCYFSVFVCFLFCFTRFVIPCMETTTKKEIKRKITRLRNTVFISYMGYLAHTQTTRNIYTFRYSTSCTDVPNLWLTKEKKPKEEKKHKKLWPFNFLCSFFFDNSHKNCMFNAETANFVNANCRWIWYKEDSTFECQSQLIQLQWFSFSFFSFYLHFYWNEPILWQSRSSQYRHVSTDNE